MQTAGGGRLADVAKTEVHRVSAFYGPGARGVRGLGRLTGPEKPTWKDRWGGEVPGPQLGAGKQRTG